MTKHIDLLEPRIQNMLTGFEGLSSSCAYLWPYEPVKRRILLFKLNKKELYKKKSYK